jgi:hypothetical protein
MVDRVFDVSSAISSAMNLLDPSIKILGTSITSKSTDILTSQWLSSVATGWTQTGIGDVIIDTSFSMSRSSWDPGLSDIIPPFRPKNIVKDLTSIADLTALISARLAR